MHILEKAFKDLEAELTELRNARLGGYDFSESENREISMENEHDEES